MGFSPGFSHFCSLIRAGWVVLTLLFHPLHLLTPRDIHGWGSIEQTVHFAAARGDSASGASQGQVPAAWKRCKEFIFRR